MKKINPFFLAAAVCSACDKVIVKTQKKVFKTERDRNTKNKRRKSKTRKGVPRDESFLFLIVEKELQ